MSDLIGKMRHLVGLNDPRKGGPYQGLAATQFVETMAEAAAELEAKDAIIAELVEAGLGMKQIVEEITGAMNHGTWRDEHGLRLKDTPEWVALYLALSKAKA